MPPRRLRWYNALGLLIALIFALFPIFWMVSTSFKPMAEWSSIPPTWISSQPTLSNYEAFIASFQSRYITASQAGWRSIVDSFICAGSATALSVFAGLLAAIAFARYRVGGNVMALAILCVRVIPPVTIAIPLLFLVGEFGLRDSYIGVILANVAFTVPFSFWMLKSFIDEVPVTIEEAGMMDGLSRWRASFQITVPLIRGGLLATTLFVFILNWNEFLITVTLVDKNVVTIPMFLHHHEGLIGIQSAIATVAALPIVIVGFLIQRHLARAFTLGAIKR